MAAFPLVALHASPWPRAIVAVVGAHVDHRGGFRAVVAGEDDQGVVGDAELLQCGHEFANDPIELMDEIAMWPGLRLAFELRRGERRQMHGLRGVKEEEGFARRLPGVLLEEFAALFQKDKIHFLHREIRRDQTGAAVVGIRVLRQF